MNTPAALLAIIAATPAMADAPAYVSSAANMCSVSPCTAAYPKPSASGDLLIAAIYAANSTVDSVTDSLGNAWTLALRQPRASRSSSTELWYTDGGTGAGADTVVVHTTNSPAPDFLEVHVYEYSGLAPGGPDCVSSQDVSAVVGDSLPCQTHVETELLFGMVNPQTNVVDGGPGFTLRQATNGDWDEDRVVTSVGSYDATFLLSGSGDVATMVAAFPAQSSSSSAGAPQALKGWPLGCGACGGAPAAGALLGLLLAARRWRGQRMPCRQSKR